ncbi:MAG: beta-ketoacyl-ACP synthase II [Deltaproteobacteria bacterium]|nr:beta-ketoacyl-ACP synthase II [Deltaproteobacteria bacterium]
MQRRVVITGVGLVTPCGIGTAETWDAITNGRPGIATITQFDASALPTTFAGEVKGFDPARWIEKRHVREMDRFIHFAVAAAQMAVDDAGLSFRGELGERAGTILGVGLGGLGTIESTAQSYKVRGVRKISPYFIPMLIANLAPGQISMRFGLKGPNIATVSACASGAHAIGDSARWIRLDEADVMITGGTESTITPLGVGGFSALRALSTRNSDPQGASRPFDRGRDGFVIAEGAGILVLEELERAKGRGATIYAELAGYGATADAYHLTQPSPDGEGAQAAMRKALASARLDPERIGYINAHGTATPTGDVVETVAIKHVFGDHARRLAVSSTKSMHGHALGAAGGIEAALSALAIRHGVLPPTINLTDPDPECDLDYVPNQAREVRVDAALSNSFGFGGTNAALVIARYKGD